MNLLRIPHAEKVVSCIVLVVVFDLLNFQFFVLLQVWHVVENSLRFSLELLVDSLRRQSWISLPGPKF